MANEILDKEIVNLVMPEAIPEPVPELYCNPMEPLNFDIDNETLNQATLMAIKNGVNTTPKGSFKTRFEMRPDGSIVCCTEPENNIITLKADHIIDMSLLRDEDPTAIDMYLKKELARKLAEQMIEEDVIKIQYSDDPATLDRTYRATVKFIQE